MRPRIPNAVPVAVGVFNPYNPERTEVFMIRDESVIRQESYRFQSDF
jgi:hypothetical protein